MFTTSQVNSEGVDLTIKPTGHNSKEDIKFNTLCEANIIPRPNTSVIIIGASGSGKSVLCAKLLNDENMLGGAFDLTLLVSSTASSDDVQKQFPVTDPKTCICENLDEAAGWLDKILAKQKEYIIEYGNGNSPLVCVILDDIIHHKKFVNSDTFFSLFMKNRHYNLTTICLSQAYRHIPKRARLQAGGIMYFASPDSENDNIVQDFCPPHYSKKKFLELIKYANGIDPYSFLFINRKVPFPERYRKNFDQIINITTDKEHGRRDFEQSNEESKPSSESRSIKTGLYNR